MHEMDFVIRTAVPGDAPALASLAGELGYPSAVAEIAGRLSKVMDAPENQVLVAEAAAHEIVGWVHVFGAARVESDGFAELGGLVVAEAWRGRGIGARLVASAEQWARENAYHKLTIRSRADRAESHQFFEHLGFQVRKTQHVFERRLDGKQ